VPTFSQDDRPIGITTPLGKDKLLLDSFGGLEGISQPFRFEASVLAPADTTVKFEDLLGQSVTIRLDVQGSDQNRRFFNGVVMQLNEGARVRSSDGGELFTRYRMVLMPKLALLQRRTNSRTFQHLSVVDILKKVLTGLPVKWQITGTFEPRDYCAQYQETDLSFASRLMEEEGIYYFFTHTDGNHEMVVTNDPANFGTISPAVKFEDFQGHRSTGTQEDRILRWSKSQEMRSGKFTAWDYNFELPDKHLEAEKTVMPSVAAGTVTHKLNVANSALELYDFPGEYAQRFDGIDAGGGEQASMLQKIFTDNKRTVEIRMQQESVAALRINGESNVRKLAAGAKFTLAEHHNGDGEYVLTTVEHRANLEGTYTSNQQAELKYANGFQAIPSALPFRPQRTTPRPTIRGTQSAVVVGPASSEIYTDKYGRVKIQFPWDREGQKDSDSSCWVRVAHIWASKQFGAFGLPRIGDEVVVAFEEGDPDQPIIVGSVYNAANMPPYVLPDNMTQTLLKTRSTTQGTTEMFNELRFEDKKDSEHIYFHAERDFNRVVEQNDTLKVGFEKHEGDDKGNQTIEIFGHRKITVKERDEATTIEKGKRTVKVQLDDAKEVVEGNRLATVSKGNDTITISEGNRSTTIDKGNRSSTISMGNETIDITAGKSSTTAGQEIELKVGSNSIVISQSGIKIKGMMISIEGDVSLTVKGLMSEISGTAMLTVKGGLVQIN